MDLYSICRYLKHMFPNLLYNQIHIRNHLLHYMSLKNEDMVHTIVNYSIRNCLNNLYIGYLLKVIHLNYDLFLPNLKDKCNSWIFIIQYCTQLTCICVIRTCHVSHLIQSSVKTILTLAL